MDVDEVSTPPRRAAPGWGPPPGSARRALFSSSPGGRPPPSPGGLTSPFGRSVDEGWVSRGDAAGAERPTPPLSPLRPRPPPRSDAVSDRHIPSRAAAARGLASALDAATVLDDRARPPPGASVDGDGARGAYAALLRAELLGAAPSRPPPSPAMPSTSDALSPSPWRGPSSGARVFGYRAPPPTASPARRGLLVPPPAAVHAPSATMLVKVAV